MKRVTVQEAREMSGLRIALCVGVPGTWGESAKALLKIRKVPFVAVAQQVFEPNDELVAWTGTRSAPVAMLDDQEPVTSWLDLVMLAERLGSGPSILPDSSADRALCLGLSAEICAPGGFGWSRRLWMLKKIYGLSSGEIPADAPPGVARILRQYGYSDEALNAATGRMIDILSNLSAQMRRQRAAGSEYLVGDRLSACDVHWACFSIFAAPLPIEDAPMSPEYFAVLSDIDPAVAAAVDPELLALRDRVNEQYIGLPLEF